MTIPFFPPVFFKSRFADGAPPLSRAECVAILLGLRRLTPELRRVVLRSLPEPAVKALAQEWWWQAHGGQEEPTAAPNGEPWRVWAIVAGRGFGKTRAGAEWVWARAREAGTVVGQSPHCPGDSQGTVTSLSRDCPLRIALVGQSRDSEVTVPFPPIGRSWPGIFRSWKTSSARLRGRAIRGRAARTAPTPWSGR